MKVLVTSNEGMIGSVVEKVLCADGCEVIGFDIANGHNILNRNEIGSALKGCDAVVHLAALLGHSEDVPNEIMAVNLLGTWHILSAAAEAKLKRVVFFSSVNVLGIRFYPPAKARGLYASRLVRIVNCCNSPVVPPYKATMYTQVLNT
ncbi:NAD(P)-dependent oxidoreductase [Nostoc sp. UHCC 0926]|nr:NAD(P)-dependent oxidoreductase [Nostoc sp. UHCC 0926]WDD35714.1 NAD(P)-dependent oxidoreductase [Nostoc sp. UHCC 0926]